MGEHSSKILASEEKAAIVTQYVSSLLRVCVTITIRMPQHFVGAERQ